MKTVGIYTLGCKVNTYESEYITNLLKKAGYQISNFDDFCDIYIINTCTVTNNSDSKSRKAIHQAIRRNPDACVIAMGCFIESHKEYQEPGIDIIVGNKDKNKIVEFIDEYFNKKETIKKLYDKRITEFDDMYITDFPGRTRAFVKIQDGCDNFCTYCIIPYVRGKCRSKNSETVIKEITELVENGYKEVVLTGIHTGSYGVDLDTTFAELLEKLTQIKNLERIRISSIECTELNDQVLNVLKNSKVIANHLHIPLQAGSNEILKLMNRKYDLEYFENKIKEIRNIRKDISISTDVIVGFPNETDELFAQTIETCKRIAFSKIHVFPYSEREGTVASKMKGKLPNNIKSTRAKKLIQVSEELEINYMKKHLNQKKEVLIEEYKDGYSYGHTSEFLHVKTSKKLEHNSIHELEIVSVEYPYVIAK